MESRRFKDKKEAVEPEADPERDQRTVFAYQVDGLLLCFYPLGLLGSEILYNLICLHLASDKICFLGMNLV